MQLFDLSVISKTCSPHADKDEKSDGTLPSTRSGCREQYSLPLAMLLYRLTHRLSLSQVGRIVWNVYLFFLIVVEWSYQIAWDGVPWITVRWPFVDNRIQQTGAGVPNYLANVWSSWKNKSTWCDLIHYESPFPSMHIYCTWFMHIFNWFIY